MSNSKVRSEYAGRPLTEGDIDKNPFSQFKLWYEEAQKSTISEANAMALATALPNGKPSLRMVLLKDFGEDGFTFFTNYQSRKGRELEANSAAALLFFWKELERQVRIEGRVTKISRDKSNEYFQTRPRGAQIAAFTSPQSEIVKDRTYLEKAYKETLKKIGEGVVPCPENWGGYIVKPSCFEFWQGRENRFHDRVQYRLENQKWVIERLAP